jgi:hypothetical protein
MEEDRPTAETVDRLEKDIEETRGRLSRLFAELDHRRHEVLSVRAHPVAAAAVGAGIAAAAAGFVFLLRRRRETPRRMRVRTRKVWRALGRVVAHPERVASDAKSPISRVLVAAAPIVIKTIASRVDWGRGGRSEAGGRKVRAQSPQVSIPLESRRSRSRQRRE